MGSTSTESNENALTARSGRLGIMTDEVKKVHPLTCKSCGMITPHAEDTVSDLESATVWHCLICGTERRPNEPGTPNEPAIV